MEHESHGYTSPTPRPSVLNVNRQATNKIVAIIFIISFLLWLVTVIYGLAVPIESTPTQFDNFDATRVFTLIGFILLSAVFTLIVFIALRWIPHITSVILWTFWIPVPMFVAGAIYQPTFWSVLSAVGSILGCLLILVLLKTEWFHMAEAVLKEACKMVISVPSVYAFALFTYLLSAFLLGITLAAIVKLALAGAYTFFNILLILMISFFGAWTMITVVALSLMTISGTFAECYYTENKGSVSIGTVFRLFAINCRYHIGTAAMYNPLVGGIRAFFYIAVLGVLLLKDGPGKSEIWFFIYNIFDPIVLRIVFMGSVVTCGIKGENFFDSMAHALNLFSNSPKRFLIVVKVTELLMGLSSGLVLAMTTFVTFGAYLGGSLNGLTPSWQLTFIYLVMLGGMVFVATLLSCLIAACYTIMLCLHEEMDLLGNAATPESAIMNPNLRSALNHDGAPNWFSNCCGSCIPDFEYNRDR